jgi:hypothetical protein
MVYNISVGPGGLCFHGGGTRMADCGLLRCCSCHMGFRCLLCFNADATGQHKWTHEYQHTEDNLFHGLRVARESCAKQWGLTLPSIHLHQQVAESGLKKPHCCVENTPWHRQRYTSFRLCSCTKHSSFPFYQALPRWFSAHVLMDCDAWAGCPCHRRCSKNALFDEPSPGLSLEPAT